MKKRITDIHKNTVSCWHVIKYSMALLLLLLAAGSCGKKGERLETPGTVSGETVAEDSGQASRTDSSEAEGNIGENINGTVAVAEFHYLPLPFLEKDFAMRRPYTINDEWMYYTREVNGTGDDWSSRYIHIDRSRISDGYREEDYYVASEATTEVTLHLLLADEEGNCYAFCGPGYHPKNEDKKYYLEKYDPKGQTIWHTELSPENLLGIGEALNQGTVTTDGRVFLYAGGQERKVFAFGKDGELETVHNPGLESLEGVVEGNDGAVYGYCLAGNSPIFVALGGQGEKYTCPLFPSDVYDGHGSDICLRNGDGLWSYDPETGETELLWKWADEYIQIDGSDVRAVFRKGENFTVMCFEQHTNLMDVKPIQTFAFVTLADRRDYPPRKVVTLSTIVDPEIWKSNHLDLLIKWYNRQSRNYRVELVAEKDQNTLEMKFMQGECSDLIDLTKFYAGNLAGVGAFEDLTSYYENAGGLGQEDILDSVREACMLSGKNVLVMPSFTIDTMRAVENVTVKDWDIWEFLEMGLENRMFETQSPTQALLYCMGIRQGEAFVDYGNRKSYFDSPEFCRILEYCGQWWTYQQGDSIPPSYSGSIQDGSLIIEGNIPVDWEEKEWMFDIMSISNPWLAVDNTDEDYSARLVGYPGREGAEYRLVPSSIFAMNSAAKNKEGAWDFLEYILSEDVQARFHWAFPARKDSFEKCLTDIYVSPERTRVLPFWDSESGKPVENGYLKELTSQDTDALRRMAENAVYDSWGGGNSPLWDIVADEAGMYFSGDSSLEDTARKIQNRVQLYLDEQ